MNVLEKIIAYKREEIAVRKLMVTEEELFASEYFDRSCLSLEKALLPEGSSGIIAEFKRRSPRSGNIHPGADVSKVTEAYARSGATALAVFTDNHFFGGNTEDIVLARKNELPVIRQDFIIDPYQVIATKAMGADAILLIAACLSKKKLKELASLAKKQGLETIIEIHAETELSHICNETDMICFNNRDPKDFKIDAGKAILLSQVARSGKIEIAGSGITDPGTVRLLRQEGFKGFLIGEFFMKEKDPGKALDEFIRQVK